MPITPAYAAVILPIPPRNFFPRNVNEDTDIFPLPIDNKQLYVYVICDFFYLKLGVQK